jgi:hypothetical protein
MRLRKEGKKERKSTIDVVRQWAVTAGILIFGDNLPDDTA